MKTDGISTALISTFTKGNKPQNLKDFKIKLE